MTGSTVASSMQQVTMRADEAQYRLLFEASPLPTWIVDEATGRFLVVNDAALAQYGYSRDEFRALTIESVRLPQESGRLRDEFRAQANTPFVLAGAWHHRRKDGSVFAVELRAARVAFNGAPAMLCFMLEADREAAVATLRLRDRQLAETEAIAHVGSWEWDARTDEVTWSRELHRVYGASWDVMPNLHEFLVRVHPEDRARVSLTISGATARGEERFEFECRLVRAANDVRTLHARHVARYDIAGRPVHLAGLVQDITDQRRADEALLANDRLHRELLEHAFDLVTLLDPAGLIVWVSPSVGRVLGHGMRAIIGHQILAFVHPDDAPHMIAALEQVVARPGVPVAAMCRVRDRDADWRVLESVGQSHCDADGRLRVVVNSRDVTGERRRA